MHYNYSITGYNWIYTKINTLIMLERLDLKNNIQKIIFGILIANILLMGFSGSQENPLLLLPGVSLFITASILTILIY